MDEAEARQRIERLTAASYEPLLDTDDVDDLVELAKHHDAAGLAPDDPEWEPTWNLQRAIAQGWETKAARAAGDFRFEEDNQSFYREQVFRHCREMAKRYSRDLVQVPMVGEEVV